MSMPPRLAPMDVLLEMTQDPENMHDNELEGELEAEFNPAPLHDMNDDELEGELKAGCHLAPLHDMNDDELEREVEAAFNPEPLHDMNDGELEEELEAELEAECDPASMRGMQDKRIRSRISIRTARQQRILSIESM